MKFRTSFTGLILLILLTVSLRAQDTVLLFHPTAYNLEIIQKLIDQNMFPLENYHVLGVYHFNENYDYTESEDYIARQKNSPFSLLQISGKLGPDNIFRENPATAQFRELFRSSAGALFMGGPDIPPLVYGEKVNLLTQVTDPFRHYLELSYIFHLLGGSQNEEWDAFMEVDPDYVINGICLGMQTLNVATGGTLIQDIPTELYGISEAEDILALPADQMHRNYMDYLNTGCQDPTSYHFHKILLLPGKFLGPGMGFTSEVHPLVLSSHHQALDRLGSGWEVAATSMDGRIVEAIQHKRYPHVFGIQFHPEKPGLFDPSIEHPDSCNSSINFQEIIAESDSYLFHVAFWNYLGQLIRSQ